MSKEEIKNQIQFLLDEYYIDLNSLDSLDALDLKWRVENKFDIELDISDKNDLTLDKIVDIVYLKLNP